MRQGRRVVECGDERRTLTKKEEISALRAFTESLPADTYLRPWLQETLCAVEQEITSDIFPSPSIKESRQRAEAEAQGIILEATTKAERILKEAEAEAFRRKKDAHNFVDRVADALQSV